MSKTFKELLENAMEKGQGFVKKTTGNAKNSIKEVTELATANEMLEKAFYLLGVEVYEAYLSSPNSREYAAFSTKLEEINFFITLKDELETSLNKRFGKIVCEKCGAKININHAFCPHCGVAQTKEVKRNFICPNCGTKNPDDHEFCGKCGTKLP